MATDDVGLHEQSLRRALRVLAETDTDDSPPVMAQRIHGLIREVTGVSDPYRGIKDDLNSLAPINRERVADGKEPYASARLFSPSELRALLRPHGPVRMRVTSVGHEGHPWSGALRALHDRVLLQCGKAVGAFIVAEVEV